MNRVYIKALEEDNRALRSFFVTLSTTFMMYAVYMEGPKGIFSFISLFSGSMLAATFIGDKDVEE